MSLFRVWRQVPVMATHSAQTNRQSRSVRTRSQTAFTLVSAFLLFSVPDCHIVRRYFETRTKAIRRITVYPRLDPRSAVSFHRKSEATHVEAKGACRRSSCIADSIRRVVPEPFQLRRTGYRPPSRASRSPLVGNSRDKCTRRSTASDNRIRSANPPPNCSKEISCGGFCCVISNAADG